MLEFSCLVILATSTFAKVLLISLHFPPVFFQNIFLCWIILWTSFLVIYKFSTLRWESWIWIFERTFLLCLDSLLFLSRTTSMLVFSFLQFSKLQCYEPPHLIFPKRCYMPYIIAFLVITKYNFANIHFILINWILVEWSKEIIFV